MPYSTNEDLKKSVPGTEKLSPKKQSQFREVWNSCHKKGQPEEQCFKTAWGVVKKASCGCGCPTCNCTPGQIIGPAVSEGLIGDATLNKDIMDSKASSELMAVSREIRPFNPVIARVLSQTAREV